eukprot:m.133423 g.133423  ORF g.133423 m.133423 type:complete len:100 (+) comp38126_c0_seq7:53-352(+)
MSEDELGFWEAPGSFAHWQDMRESWLENLRETQVPELGNNNSIQGLSGDTSDSEMTDSSRTEASNVSRESPGAEIKVEMHPCSGGSSSLSLLFLLWLSY